MKPEKISLEDAYKLIINRHPKDILDMFDVVRDGLMLADEPSTDAQNALWFLRMAWLFCAAPSHSEETLVKSPKPQLTVMAAMDEYGWVQEHTKGKSK